jgi:hypothetical protein
MTKTHYDPYCYNGTSGPEGDGEYYDPGEYHLCGTRVTDNEDTLLTRDWNKVTCKRCLKQIKNIDEDIERNEKLIVDSMGDMVEFMGKGEK